MPRFLLLLFALSLLRPLGGETLFLEGHLGKKEMAEAEKELDALSGEGPLLLVVSSLSGDLEAVLEFCRRLYGWKEEKEREVVVYIKGDALGPAALVPFLGDRRTSSPFASWGDLLFGSGETLPVNILRSRVLSLISDRAPEAKRLKEAAEAMLDGSLGPWLQQEEPALSKRGERLVLGRQELERLGLIDEALPFSELLEEEPMRALPESSEEKGTLFKRLEQAVSYSKEGANRIGRIAIDDRKTGINQGTWLYVKSALDHYKKERPAFILLELDTPGGEVFASQQISNALKEIDLQHGIPVVAYIHDWAISAGAMLAYSCRFIAASEYAAMGAAEPVIQGEKGLESASEKINSALRTDFGNRAEFFGRNPEIAQAMVDKDLILVFRHGKVVKLDREEEIRRSPPDPDRVITTKGKLLTLNSEEMMRYGVADLEVKAVKLDPIEAAEKERGRVPAEKIALFHTSFFKEIPNAYVESFRPDWQLQFLIFLSHPVVAGLLFMGVLIGFYIEINTPGFGVPGGIALASLFLIFLSSFSMEAAGWLEAIMLGLGLLLLFVDLFLLPSFGLLGGLGILLSVAGLFALLLPGLEAVDYDFDGETWNAAGEYVLNRLAWLALSLLLGLAVIALLARTLFPRLAPFNRLILSGSEQEGYLAGEDPKELPRAGVRGSVLAALRPSGKILIEGRLYEAMSGGEYIERGASIRVVRLEGSVIIVEEVL